jgi:hypothetical protein
MNPSQNPFAGERIASIAYRFADGECDHLLQKLQENNWHGAIVGPHGTGKSTLIKYIEEQARKHHRQIKIIDGAEQIPWWKWFVIKRRAKQPLIITTHKPGRLPTLYTTSTSSALLQALIIELAIAKPKKEFVEDLYARHSGNIRDALREMYDRCYADDTSWIG